MHLRALEMRSGPPERAARLAVCALIAWSSVSAAACTGVIGNAGEGPGRSGGGATPPGRTDFVSVSGLRRSSAYEIDATLRDLFGSVVTPSALLLPEDVRTPFDNDYTTQTTSDALAEGLELLAMEIGRSVAADTETRERVAGCAPSGPDDTDCFRSFIRSFGRRAFRRPLDTAQIDRYMGALDIAVETGDFWVAVATVIARDAAGSALPL